MCICKWCKYVYVVEGECRVEEVGFVYVMNMYVYILRKKWMFIRINVINFFNFYSFCRKILML